MDSFRNAGCVLNPVRSPTLKNKAVPLVLIALLTASLSARACINEIGTNHRGEHIELIYSAGQKLKPYLVTPTTKAALLGWSRDVSNRARKEPTFENLNDLAAVLIRHGRYPEAAKLLQFLERKYPGHYETASNVGTAYELMGQNEDALKWILEGLKRNPEDHDGTEWLHVHILKAKLGQIPPPAPGRSILNLDFGNDVMPRRPTGLPLGNTGKPMSLYSVAEGLRYQLIERIEFVAAPDPMISDLLLDWANLELLAGSVESADVLYDAAIRYGSKEGRIISIRKTQVARILAQAKSKKTSVQGQCELCVPPSPDSDK
jgi:tetratricopeptide (TPR) repeat protein